MPYDQVIVIAVLAFCAGGFAVLLIERATREGREPRGPGSRYWAREAGYWCGVGDALAGRVGADDRHGPVED